MGNLHSGLLKAELEAEARKFLKLTENSMARTPKRSGAGSRRRG